MREKRVFSRLIAFSTCATIAMVAEGRCKSKQWLARASASQAPCFVQPCVEMAQSQMFDLSISIDNYK